MQNIIDILDELPEDAKLSELFPFLEMDVFVLIRAFEEGARSTGKESGLLASSYGEVGKVKTSMGFMVDTSRAYGGMKEDSNGLPQVGFKAEINSPGLEDIPPIVAKDGKTIPNPFAECFPCKGRLSACMDNLPLPDFLHIFDELIALCENFVKAFKQLLDKENYYKDICALVDACRFLCPQDIIIMMQSLQFNMAHTIKLSLKLDMDFMSFIGILLFPLFMLMYMLLDTLSSIAVNPMDCTLQYLVTFKDAMDKMMELPKNINPGSVSVGIDLPNGISYGAELDKTDQVGEARAYSQDRQGAEGKEDAFTPLERKDVGASTNNLPPVPEKVITALAQMDKPLTAFESVLVRVSEVTNLIKNLSEIWKKSAQASLGMLTKEMADKMSLVLSIMQMIRTLEFLKAMLTVLKNNQICVDPRKPLSPTDIENVLKNIPTFNKTIDSGSGDTPPVFDPVTGTISIQDSTGRTISLPSCIGKIPDTIRNDVEQWVRELDSAVV